MSALANLVIADNTPTNHTFYPISRENGVLRFVNRESTTQAGNMLASLSLAYAQKGKAVNRVRTSFVHPFEVTVDGLTTVRDFAQANTDFILPVGMTAAELTRFATMHKNMQALAAVFAYYGSLDPMVS